MSVTFYTNSFYSYSFGLASAPWYRLESGSDKCYVSNPTESKRHICIFRTLSIWSMHENIEVQSSYFQARIPQHIGWYKFLSYFYRKFHYFWLYMSVSDNSHNHQVWHGWCTLCWIWPRDIEWLSLVTVRNWPEPCKILQIISEKLDTLLVSQCALWLSILQTFCF